MKAVLAVQCSPRFGSSASRAAAERVLARLIDREPGLPVIRRDLANHPPALVDEAFAEAIRVPLARQSVEHREALKSSEALIAELEETDGLVIGTPMHNFTVPAVLKAWIDQVVRIGRTFQSTPSGKKGLLADRPTYVVIATGGSITGEHARQPDFLTPYLGAILATLGIRTVSFLHLEAVRSNPDPRACVDGKIDRWLDARLPVSVHGACPCPILN